MRPGRAGKPRLAAAALPVLAGLLPAVVVAEPDGAAPVVVVASRIPTSLENITSAVTIITREDIAARQASSVTDLLRGIPGLHVDQPGGRGGVSSVYLRGGDPNFVLVLVDGVPVNDPTNSRGGSYDFSNLNVNGIERIEVLRGPASSLYGSAALAGAINIVTHDPTAPRRTGAKAGIGSQGYWEAAAQVGGVLKTGAYHLAAGYVDDGTPVEGSQFIGRSADIGVDLAPSGNSALRFVSRYSNNDAASFPDDSGGPAFAVLRASDARASQDVSAGLDYTRTAASGTLYRLQANHYAREDEFASPGVAPGIRDPFGIPLNASDSAFHRTGMTASVLVSIAESARITAGVAADEERGTSDSVVEFGGVPVPGAFDLKRSLFAAFVEGQYAANGGMILQGGVRLDSPEDFDPELSPHAGVRFPLGRGETEIRANWAQGFKLPSFFALGHPIVGNPTLQPETSESSDIGVLARFTQARAHAGATLFHNRFFDVIDLDEGPPPKLVNRSEVTARGAELSGGLSPADDVDLSAQITYTRTDIVGTDEPLRNRPKWRGSMDARYRASQRWKFNGALVYVGETPDSSIPTGDVTLDDYVRVDVAATWTAARHLQASLAVDNLLDAEYEEAVGFPAPGIRLRLTIRAEY